MALDEASFLRDAVYLSRLEQVRPMDDGLLAVAGRIDVWLTFQDEIHDQSLLTAFASLLSKEEARRNAAYHFARDRKCDLVTRALVRTALSRYASVQPRDWTFITNQYGKPEILDPVPEAVGLTFNVSHTHGLIALAVASDVRIGIDVESADAHDGLAALAVDVLSPDELSAFESLSAAKREQAFLRHWTLKESYVKARGVGLSLPLCSFSIGHVLPCTQQMDVDLSSSDSDEHWVFGQYQISQGHVLALCFAHSASHTPQLCFRRVVPLQMEEVLQPQPLRCLFPHAHSIVLRGENSSEQPLTT